jgi:hypothetical protein
MPQTVFDVGDLITSRLNLGVTPDGTTAAAVVVKRPDGTVITGLNTSAWVGMEKTVQWWATDDGTASGTKLAAAGDWLAVWTVTGTGASVSPKIYPVRALPAPDDGRPVWAPFLSDVADHVPFLTVDSVSPGTQAYLGTFTGATSPTDEQAHRHLDAAVSVVSSRVGTVLPESMYGLARATVALRAAASILRAFARNRDDREAAGLLDERADATLVQLTDAADVAGTATPAGPLPAGYFPEPVAWGDCNL